MLAKEGNVFTMRILEFLPIFLQWNPANKETKKKYSQLTYRLVEVIGDIELGEVKEHIFKFFEKVDHLDPTTYNNYRRHLHVVFEAAKKRDLINTNPLDLIPTKRPITDEGGLFDEHEVKTIPREIVMQILRNIRTKEQLRYALAIHLIAETGARPIEVCRLKRENFSGNCVHFKVTKTGSPRHVLFPEGLANQIRDFIKTEPGLYLIPRSDGGMMRVDRLTKIFARNSCMFRTYDNPDETIKLYWLRHTKAVQLFGTLPLVTAAKLLGMSIATANRYYGFTKTHSEEAWQTMSKLSYVS